MFFGFETKKWTRLQQAPSYGMKGVASAQNWPPARNLPALHYNELNDSFYMFGGESSPFKFHNDLWKFDVKMQQWIWIAGSDSLNLDTTAEYPGGRNSAGSCVQIRDNSFSIYLFFGKSANQTSADIWRIRSSEPIIPEVPTNMAATILIALASVISFAIIFYSLFLLRRYYQKLTPAERNLDKSMTALTHSSSMSKATSTASRKDSSRENSKSTQVVSSVSSSSRGNQSLVSRERHPSVQASSNMSDPISFPDDDSTLFVQSGNLFIMVNGKSDVLNF